MTSGRLALRLLPEERRQRIVELIEQQGRATVKELAERFEISPVTIRADLEVLARNAVIVRAHGGALPAHAVDTPLSIKELRRHAQKRHIGLAAATLVKDGETIILDSGSTTMEIARALRQRKWKELTVITNGLHIALELSAVSAIRVVMLGGLLRASSQSLVGSGAEQVLAQLSADRLFLGVDGIDSKVGMTTPDPQEASLNALMIRVSREVVGVFGSNKFGLRSLSVIAPLSALNIAITEQTMDVEHVQAMHKCGVRVILV
jgi:DeoR family transcriptional regulator of aga operon